MPKAQDPTPEMRAIGANIHLLRRKLKITQKELAAPQFSVSYISAIERGRIWPSLKALFMLARRLNVTPAELLTEFYDDPPPTSASDPEDKAGAASSLVALINDRHPAYRVSLAFIWVSIAIDQGHLELTRELLDQSLSDSLSTEQRLIHSYLLSRVLLETGQSAEAQALLEPVLQQDRFGGHPELLESCRFRLGCAYAQQGKFLLASETFSACTQAMSNGLITDHLFVIEIHTTIAEYYRRLDRRDMAIGYYRLALDQLDLLSNPAALAEHSAQLSQQQLESGHSSLAYWYATRSRSFLELAEARRQIIRAASGIGLTLQELGDPGAAEQQLRQAIDLSERLEMPDQSVLSRLALADLLLKRTDLQGAEELAREAEALCRPSAQNKINDATLYGRALVTLGVINKALGSLDVAESSFQQAIEILQGQNAPEPLSDAYYGYSELLYQRGEIAEGFKMINLAYQLRRTSGAGG